MGIILPRLLNSHSSATFWDSSGSWSTNICLIFLRVPFSSSRFPQLEESEFTSAAAVKARKSMELEIEDLHIQMEDVVKAKITVSFHI